MDTAIAVSYGGDRVHTGEIDTILEPRLNVPRPGVTFFHGATGDGTDAVTPSQAGQYRLLRDLARRYPMTVAPLGGIQTWAQQLVVDRAIESMDFLEEELGCPEDDHVLFGGSMGSIAALIVAALVPTRVRCVVTYLTIPDLVSIYNEDVEGAQAPIGTAHGVTHPTPLPAGATPLDHVEVLSGIPWLGYYSTDDQFNTPQQVTDFAFDVGGTVVSLGALGHTQAHIAEVADRIDDVYGFIEAAA